MEIAQRPEPSAEPDLSPRRDAFEHEALFYSGEEGFMQGTLPFIGEGLVADEPVLVAVSSARIELLRGALRSEAERVSFIDMHLLGRNPARIIPAWHQFLAKHAPDGRPVRGIGEPIWTGRSAAELTECQRHESLLNLAFDEGQAWRLLCPYDVDLLDEQVIEAAHRTHPLIARDGESQGSEKYHDEAPSPFDGRLPAPAGETEELAFTVEDLRGVRSFVSAHASSALLDEEATEHLVLAINELATNSVHYGGGRGTLRIWRENDTLLCEVHDRGRIEEPLVGCTPPSLDQHGGRGLWLVNHLCDLVQIRATPEGNVVRVHMGLV